MSEHHRLSLQDWHRRYKQQARWSGAIRRYLIKKANLDPEDKILEIGSGTGAVLEMLIKEAPATSYGIDLDYKSLKFSAEKNPQIRPTAGDGYRLPFSNNAFKMCLCHYLLLWVENPSAILSEMVRVTQRGGVVLALAEPDYQARIDYPPPLDHLGRLQNQSLGDQGADTAIGRKLAGLFYQVGLKEITSGIIGAQWESMVAQALDVTEWMMIKADLSGDLSSETLVNFRRAEIKTRKQGERVLFIPTFYAVGMVSY